MKQNDTTGGSGSIFSLLNSPYLCLFVTGSSQPLCRWWRLGWFQMTPLYSQSDDLFPSYDLLVVHLCVLCCFNTLSSLHVMELHALLIRATDCKEHILIGWLWGYLCDQSAEGSLESASQNQSPAHSSNTRATVRTIWDCFCMLATKECFIEA